MLETRLQLKLQQKLVMTPQLQQAIKLLQLSKMDLVQHIEQEMLENPLLEDGREADKLTEDNVEEERTDDLEELTPEQALEWERYLNDGRDMGYVPRESPDHIPYENIVSPDQTLEEHLAWQINMIGLEPDDERIALQLAGNVDSKGYLGAALADVASIENSTIEHVEELLLKVQRQVDPVGVLARDVRECLLLQLEARDRLDSLAARIVEECLSDLERRALPKMARKLDATMDEIHEAIDEIKSLEPKPGRNFASEHPQYVTPDVYIIKVDGKFKILLNDNDMPRLRISKTYRKLLNNDNDVSEDTKDYVEQKVSSALWLMKSVRQRQQSIYKVSESILERQKEFFEHGISYLKPLVLRDVAEDIDVHESTVSRVSSNKYMHTPQGVFEIKYFFHSGLSSENGPDVSSIRVKEMIRRLIDEENKRKPLSDRKIMAQLKDRGIVIARRTVAKYREELGIPSSTKRKRYK